MAGKGGRRSTTWGPGQGGNPKGRPKLMPDVRAAASEYTQEALDRLAFWMRSNHPTASTVATQALLDRGHGKPTQSHDVKLNASVAVADDAALVSLITAGGGVAAEEEAGSAQPTGVVH